MKARAVSDGLPGDIVALALPLDVDKICEAGLIAPGWQQRLPNNAVVAESVVALVTRKGNPKNIRGWNDLTRSVSRITQRAL
jgi:ABC-type sulfate transport system substrate-binding protein